MWHAWRGLDPDEDTGRQYDECLHCEAVAEYQPWANWAKGEPSRTAPNGEPIADCLGPESIHGDVRENGHELDCDTCDRDAGVYCSRVARECNCYTCAG